MDATTYRYRPSTGNRASAILASLAICALIVLMLVRMGMLPLSASKIAEKLTAITFRPETADHNQHRQAAHKQKEERRAAAQPNVTPQQPKPKEEPVPPVQLLKLSRQEFAAADISKMARHPAQSGDSTTGPNSAAAYGPGEGPGGMHLFRAEWYREPTDAEMVTYMPHRDVSGGWAEIACKMEDHYHVDDCRELGESPPGSGLSRALRLASWQFLVRPPRVNGQPQLGTWVRIHFDFTRAREPATSDTNGG